MATRPRQAPAESADRNGFELGRYRVVRHLATGGMAELYLARTRGIADFEKLVVLKRILPHYAQDAHFVRMFLEEAKLAAALQHSNIAQVYDIGSEAGSYFFTMEFVHGVDVRQLMKAVEASGDPLPLEHAVGVVMNAASGLHHAHEQVGSDGFPLGIVHRDVSPSNLLVGFDGGVKVADFGIAKATLQRSETQPGTLKGKTAYMSPEQCRGDVLDRRSDVFALGIILYELTTGTRLFDYPSDFLTLKHIVEHDVLPPSSCAASYPPELERIVLTALRRDPTERYRTAEDLYLELETFARERRLAVSRVGLARYLERLFGNETAAWQDARRAGMSMEDYLTSSVGEPVGAPPPHEERDITRARPDESAPPGSADSVLLGVPADAAPRVRRRRIGIVLAAAAVAGGVGIGWANLSPAPATSAAAPAASAAPSAASAAPSAASAAPSAEASAGAPPAASVAPALPEPTHASAPAEPPAVRPDNETPRQAPRTERTRPAKRPVKKPARGSRTSWPKQPEKRPSNEDARLRIFSE